MGVQVKGYLTEKSILEIWAARPASTMPLYERTATSRALAKKFNIYYKTVQKIWNKRSWSKVTDRAPVTAQTQGQCADMETGMPDTTEDALPDVGAGAGPDHSPLPQAGVGPDHSPLPPISSTPPLASHFFSAHQDSRPPSSSNLVRLHPPSSSNLVTQDNLLLSVGVDAGMMPNFSGISPFSSLASSPQPPHLSQQGSPLLASNITTPGSSPHNHTDSQGNGTITQYHSKEPASGLAEFNWMRDNCRSMQTGGRQRADPACFHCKAQQLKCDGSHPCGTCWSQGLASHCVFDAHQQNDLLPSCALHSAAATMPMLSPEHPIAYPDGPIRGVSFVLPPLGADNPWPLSMVRLFKGHRLADAHYSRILRLMTPKLRDVMLRIFSTVDSEFVSKMPQPKPPTEWTKSSQNSLRCGMMTLRIDFRGDVIQGVDANPFWTDLAGLHKEEFANRALSGELNLPTSELRQFCKLVFNLTHFMRWRLGLVTDPTAPFDFKPVYLPFSRNWGRGSPSDGVMTRMRATSTPDKDDPKVCYLNTSIVIISPEEFESVRAQQPELCEGYLIPVVGSKSAKELMDPRLLVEESFEYLNSSPEGRATLDRLADTVASEYRFMFDFIAEKNQTARAQVSGEQLSLGRTVHARF